MKWRYIIPILLFYALVLAAYFAMTLRHAILTWIVLFFALFLVSQAARVYLLLRAKRINDDEGVRRLTVGIQTELVLDLPFFLIVLVLYLCELNDWLILIVGSSLALASTVLREYLKRRYFKVNGQSIGGET